MIAKRPAVLYLLPDRFHFFSPTLPSIIEFHYVPEFIRHQDIINQDLFENVLKLFIENGKIPPSSLLVIIADSACYIKDIVNLGVTQPQGQVPQQPQMDHAQMEKQAQEFIEYVPFDKVASKVIAIPGGMRVYAANLELLQSLRNVFEKEGSSIEMVLPALVFGTAVSNKPALDIQTANIFMQRMNEFRQQNMFEIIPMQVVKAVKRDSEPSMDADVPMLPQDNKPDKKRLYFMVGFLGFLLIILVVVFINSQTPPPKKASEIAPAAQPPVQNTVSTTAPPPQVIATAVPVASASAQDLTVQLTGTTDSANTLQPMQLDFTKQGFKSVLVNSQTVAASETIVTFSDRTSPETKQQVINVVQKYAPNPVVQQKADALNDISIIVGK